ncbi:oxidoreductase [Actinokineospora sp. NBRC 105648]|nr:oxidoreductase [Actinokineospora sp. NBRC 105648]
MSAGRVGAVLGAALDRAGHTVTATSAVSRESLRRAEELLPDAAVLPPDEVAKNADLVLLALPDDALAGMVRGLVAAGAIRPGQIVVHTSGAHGVDVLGPVTDHGALGLALHPVMTFTGRPEDLQRIVACSFGVTAADGDEVAWNVAEALVVEMGAEPVRVPEAARPLYHTALAHGANHLVTLVGECADLLRQSGIGTPERLLGPLLSAALDNALRHGDRALTGPVARGDVGTVRKHVTVLTEHAPHMLPAYRALAARTARRAVDSGLLRADLVPEVEAAIEEETP